MEEDKNPKQNQIQKSLETPVVGESIPTDYQPQANSMTSFLSRFILTIILAVYGAAVTILLTTGFSLPWPFTAALLVLPLALAAWKRIEGILLPYAVSVGIALSVLSIKSVLGDVSESDNVRNYIPVFSDHIDSQIFIASSAVCLVTALVVFVAANYGPRLSRVVSNLFFRILAIWMIFFFSPTAYWIVDKAEVQAKQADYEKAKIFYEQTTLDEKLFIYDPVMPASYEKSSAYANDDSPEHASYALLYSSKDARLSDITVKVSLDKVPGNCEDTMVPRVQTDKTDQLYSCDIVLKSDGGQNIYGYRHLSDLPYQGIDPKNLSADDLRHVQPDIFYIQKSDNLIELSYGNYSDKQLNPLNISAVNAFADSLKPLSAAAKAEFITQSIKPPIPLQPLGPNEEYRSAAIRSVAIAFYVAIFLWAMEKLFTKAGRTYWKVYIPIVNLWILTKIAGRPGWWSLLAYLDTNPYSSANVMFILRNVLFSPVLIPLMTIMTIIRFILFVLVSTSMTERFGKPKLFSLLLIIPPFPGYLILGFDKSEYQKKPDQSVEPNIV